MLCGSLPQMRLNISQDRLFMLMAGCICNNIKELKEGGDLPVALSVEEKVKKIVGEQLGVDEEEITPDASFVEDLGADSLDTVELVMAFEEEFSIEIPDEDAEKIITVQNSVDYIKERM